MGGTQKIPGLVEDELICAMDESDVSLKAMSFTTKNIQQKFSETTKLINFFRQLVLLINLMK